MPVNKKFQKTIAQSVLLSLFFVLFTLQSIAQSLIYRTGFDYSQSIRAREGGLLVAGNMAAFGPYVFPLKYPQVTAPQLTLEGDQSQVSGLYLGNGVTYVKTKIKDEYGYYIGRENLLAYSLSNGALRWQVSNRFTTPIAPNSTGYAQVTSFDGGCQVTQTDNNAITRYVNQSDLRPCVLSANANSPSIFAFYVNPSPQLGFRHFNADDAGTITTGSFSLLPGESYCGSKHLIDAMMLATCRPGATRIWKIAISAGQSEWTQELPRTGQESDIVLQALGNALFVNSAGDTVTQLQLTDGAVQWQRQFANPVIRVRASLLNITEPVTVVITSACDTQMCTSINVASLSATGATVLEDSVVVADAADSDVVPCDFDPLCLLTSAEDFGARRLVKRQVFRNGKTLLSDELYFGTTASSAYLNIASTETHTYVAALDTGGNIRIKKIRADTGALEWIKNYDLSSFGGTVTEARMVSISASDAMVGMGFNVSLRQSNGSVRRKVIFERLFASTGARLKPTEFDANSEPRQSAMSAVVGSDLWTGYEQGNFSGTGGSCNLWVQKISLDSQTTVPVRLDCLLGRAPSMSLLGADVLVPTVGRFSRISATGLVYTRSFEDPDALLVAPDGSRFLHLSRDAQGISTVATMISATDGLPIWTRTLSVNVPAPGRFLTPRASTILANNDVLLGLQLRQSGGIDGAAQMYRLAAATGETLWQIAETFRIGKRPVFNSLLASSESGVFWALKKHSNVQKRAYLDNRYVLERRSLSNGEVLSQQTLGFFDQQFSSVPESALFGIMRQTAPNRLQMHVLLPGLEGYYTRYEVALLDTTIANITNLSVSGEVQRTQPSFHQVKLRVRNTSATPVASSELVLSSSGYATWLAVQCQPACLANTSLLHRGKFLTLPANSEVTVTVDVLLDERAPVETFKAAIVLPSEYAETNMDDNGVELQFGETHLRDGFE